MSVVFPDPKLLSARIVAVDEAAAAAHVSRGTTPDQIGRYQLVCGNPPDPKLAFCAAGGSYGVLRATADCTHTPYTDTNAVEVFRSLIPLVEAHWIKISASCEEVRQWAIAHDKWMSVDEMPDDMVFRPGWVALLNYETAGPEAHHYATIIRDSLPGEDQDELHTVEFNTTAAMPGGSQGNGGCVATKLRPIDNPHFRGIVRTW